MKIALVCPYNMFERSGGVQQVIQHLHDGLSKKGHEVKVITQRPSNFKGEAPKDYILFGIVRDFKSGLGFGVAGNLGMPANGDEIIKILDKEKFDVINFHEPWAPILAWQMLKHSRAAHVGTFHANLVDGVAAKTWPRVFTPYARGIGRKMQIITAVSPAPASLMISKAQTSFEKKLVSNIKYIPNGIDLRVYKPPKKRLPLNGPNTKTVVYVGRLDRRKGVDWLLKAFAVLSDKMPNAYLIIAGEGPRRRGLEQLARQLDIRNIHFSGYVDEAEKIRLMGNADAFCSPAIFGESFGIVLLEAMAAGAPVVAGRNSGYINVLTDRGRVGLVDPKATADFTDRLALILTDDKINNLLRQWGLREVKKYDYPKIIDQYELAYKEALQIITKQRNGKSRAKINEENPKKPIRRFFVRRHA